MITADQIILRFAATGTKGNGCDCWRRFNAFFFYVGNARYQYTNIQYIDWDSDPSRRFVVTTTETVPLSRFASVVELEAYFNSQ